MQAGCMKGRGLSVRLDRRDWDPGGWGPENPQQILSSFAYSQVGLNSRIFKNVQTSLNVCWGFCESSVFCFCFYF